MRKLQSKTVLLFVPTLRGGGAERAMLNTAKAFLYQGYEVKIAVCQLVGEYIAEVPDEIEIIDLKSSRVMTGVFKLLFFVRRIRPILLLSTLTHTNVAICLSKPLFPRGVKLVLRESSTPSMTLKETSRIYVKFMFKMIPFFYRLADGIAAVSFGVKRDLEENFGIRAEKIFLAPNAVVTDEIQSLAAQAPDIWPEGQVVLCVGRLVPAKNFSMMLRAFSKVADQVENCKLVILGEGPERKKLVHVISKLGLEEKVLMPGFKSNPYSYMSRCSVFVLSSNREGFPNVLVQAVYCGAKVVATNCKSGPSDLLVNENQKYLVPVNDPDSMAKKLIEVLKKQPEQNIDISDYHVSRSADYYIEALGLEKKK